MLSAKTSLKLFELLSFDALHIIFLKQQKALTAKAVNKASNAYAKVAINNVTLPIAKVTTKKTAKTSVATNKGQFNNLSNIIDTTITNIGIATNNNIIFIYIYLHYMFLLYFMLKKDFCDFL